MPIYDFRCLDCGKVSEIFKAGNKLCAALIVAVLIWKDSCLHLIWSERIVRLLALPAVAGLSVVMHHPALQEIHAGGTEGLKIEKQ